MNRIIKLHNDCRNIYVDEGYLYTIGNNWHQFYERSLPVSYISEMSYRGVVYTNKSLMGMIKLVYNGDDYMFAIEEQKVSLYRIRLQKPMLNCPVQFESEEEYPPLLGQFTFQLNSTARSCPSKLNNSTLLENPSEKFNHVCVFSKYLHIEFSEPWVMKGVNQKTFRAYVWILIGVICAILLVCW